MMAAVKIRKRALVWWQELLILWLLYGVAVLVGDALVTRVLGWEGMLPHNPYTFLVMTFAWAAAMTAVTRRQRRRRSSTP
jgi:hypothetical protein